MNWHLCRNCKDKKREEVETITCYCCNGQICIHHPYAICGGEIICVDCAKIIYED